MHDAARAGEPFELVVLDGQMPGMDGIELGQAISLAPSLRGARLVMLTSTTDRRAAAREAGIAHYLQKPVRRAAPARDRRRGAGRGARTDGAGRRSRLRRAARGRDPGRRGQRRQPAGGRGHADQARLRGRVREQRPRGDLDARRAPVRARVHGLPDAGDGRLRGDDGDPLTREGHRAAADRGHDRARHEGRPRALPGRGHGRLPVQAAAPGRARRGARALARGAARR